MRKVEAQAGGGGERGAPGAVPVMVVLVLFVYFVAGMMLTAVRMAGKVEAEG